MKIEYNGTTYTGNALEIKDRLAEYAASFFNVRITPKEIQMRSIKEVIQLIDLRNAINIAFKKKSS